MSLEWRICKTTDFYCEFADDHGENWEVCEVSSQFNSLINNKKKKKIPKQTTSSQMTDCAFQNEVCVNYQGNLHWLFGGNNILGVKCELRVLQYINT